MENYMTNQFVFNLLINEMYCDSSIAKRYTSGKKNLYEKWPKYDIFGLKK